MDHQQQSYAEEAWRDDLNIPTQNPGHRTEKQQGRGRSRTQRSQHGVETWKQERTDDRYIKNVKDRYDIENWQKQQERSENRYHQTVQDDGNGIENWKQQEMAKDRNHRDTRERYSVEEGWNQQKAQSQHEKIARMVIENRIMTDSNNNKSGNTTSLMDCLTSRRSMIIIGLYLFFSTGALFYLLSRGLRIPGLQGQIRELEGQVEKLDAEVIELQTQIDRFSSQVDRLKDETDELSYLNTKLEVTVNDLNTTVTHLAEQNPILQDNLESYEALNRNLENTLKDTKELNAYLNGTVIDLRDDLQSLNSVNDDLTSTVQDLNTERISFATMVEELLEQNQNLDGRVEALETEVNKLKEQNSFLSDNNDDLVSIMAFLTEASINLNTTTDALANHLADDISENSFILLQDLQLHYQNTFTLWPCFTSFDFLYGDKAWVEDKGVAIGSDYPEFIEFLNDNVFEKICADKSDFEAFLVSDPIIGYTGASPPVGLTYYEITSGLERYATSMMDYYFTSEGEDEGLSELDWTNAGYDCNHLEDSSRFEWS